MSTLTAFRAALLDPEAAPPTGLSNANLAPAGSRYAVYRNNVTVALRDALRASFPVLVKLIGPQNFDMLAGIYLRSHPPTSPLMMYYGAEMPAFLRDFEPLSHIGYLPDIAQLEIAIRESYHSADAAPLPAEALASLSPDALSLATLHLAPSLRLIASQWPLYDIWRFNMVQGAEKPRNIAQPVLVTRPEFDPEPHPITQADVAWLRAIQNGQTLGTAQQAATQIDSAYDLGPLLTLLLQTGALTDLTTKDDPHEKPA